MAHVVARNVVYEIEEAPYWHLTPPRHFLLHNARLAEGIVWSVSAFAELPGMENAATPYSLTAREAEKERVFEAVRQRDFPDRPSREKAVFLFEAKADAERALREWFPNEERAIVEARIVVGSKRHRADARWLDGFAPEWEARAGRYWAAEMTADPRPEVILHGQLYLPAWETFTLRPR